jgi:hypothetical protein
VVFILFSDLARIDEFRPALVEAVGPDKVERLRNYFQINPTRDPDELSSSIDLIWVRTLKELMDGERRAKPPPLQTFDQGKAAQELSAGRQFCCPLQMNPEGRAEFTDQHVALG